MKKLVFFTGVKMNLNKKCVFSLTTVFFLAFTLGGLALSGNQKDSSHFQTITDEISKKGLAELGAFSILKKITGIGPRLTGSPQAAAAVELMLQEMKDLGLDNVHLEPTLVPRWIRGLKEESRLISSAVGTLPLSICSLGGSIGTPKNGMSSQVLEVNSFDELNHLGDQAKGKIVFFNRAMDPSLLDTFAAYGGAAEQRVQGAIEGAKAGAVAVLVRSLTSRLDNFPHTGIMRYSPDIEKIPAACISTIGANLLSNALKNDPKLQVFMSFDCQNLSPVTSYNVIGQLTGTEKPEEIILVGGHLDSWDLSPGAHDDGAGCAHSLEALRLIKELGLHPKRTIRAVMFMDEESGGTGGRDYAAASEREKEFHLAAIESDRGGFLPLRFGIGGSQEAFQNLKKWDSLFLSLGMFGMSRGGGGVDIAPLAEGGTITIGLIPDSQRYFDVHHSGRDVLDTVNPRELELGAIAMTVFTYVMAQDGIN
ncbi:MAG: M20/M25/M40 family metallo-hydrolase [Candidatus Aminicenantes bacterium]|nr:M20/M25/M40 family metallo-hydrolase [Candidatus Aminicenantes bacterium]